MTFLALEDLSSNPKNHRYRAFLLDLDRNFKKDDLEDLMFALKDVIPARKMEKFRRPRDAFSALEERSLLGPNKLEALRGYLDAIDRADMHDRDA